MEKEQIEIVIKIIKILIINYFTMYTALKIINQKDSYKQKIITFLLSLIVTFGILSLDYYIGTESSNLFEMVYSILFLTFLLCLTQKTNVGYALVVNVISLSLNYILLSVSVIFCGILYNFFKVNQGVMAILIFSLYLIFLRIFLSLGKLKNGFDFIQKNIKNGNLDIVILNIGVIIIFFVTFITNFTFFLLRKVFISIILVSIIMFITISKSFQQYYKHRLLLKELDSTKAELDQMNKNNKDLEKENIEINKVNHTLSHKLKALEHKINKLLMNEEIAKELSIVEKNKIKENFEDISKEVYKEKAIVSLTKTEIPNIDNMLELMQEECIKNKIEFELQIIGNIFHMTNNYISKEELEILIADHVKDAIIAINHSDNEYRSILVRLGKIDNCYSLYIYDSGIEFEEETLKNIGKKPSTTHAEEGGTGLGFMNTFDTLRKHNASLIIKEISKPCKNNYTKVLMIKFDGKNNFQVKSYKTNTKIEETIKK